MRPSGQAFRPTARWLLGNPLLALLLMLGACAQTPPQLPPVTSLPDNALGVLQSVATAPEARPALADFEHSQRAAAEAAVTQGRWADAAWAWDVLLALHPGDADLRRQQVRAHTTALQQGSERLLRAQQAHQRGDGDTAARLYLEALALLPGQEAAADGLRALERDRIKRQHLGQLSRNTLLRRAPGSPDARVLADQPSAASMGSGSENMDLEHASLLATQGETDAAIALLIPHVNKDASNKALRRMLAALYVRKAEKLATSDPAAALSGLQQSLVLDAGEPKALQLLNQLQQAKQRRIPRKPTREGSP